MGNLQSYPSSSRKKYDVFINFRGKDTRDCFTSHLYEALRRKGIETFIDNQIEKGDELSSALMRAINESKISVVIFSEDYATAKWCLRELVEILKCKKMNNHIVLPVFFRVFPSDVRHQTGSFKDPFVEHEKNLQKEVQTWREALAEACGIIGWQSWHSSDGRTDATLVNAIVDDIWKKLMSEYIPPDFGKLIGLKPRIEQIMASLCLHVTTDVRIIGIWGMGGIGKTTLANAIFNQNLDQFKGVCFIRNVRERLEKCGGLDSVKEEILSKVLKDGDLKLDSLTIPPKIKERLNRLRVFIVFDDVDNSLKMETLVEGVDGLGQGSRIIITSRDKQVLRNCHVNDDNICEVKGLNCHEALQLFCKYAFHENCHSEDPMVYHLVKFINGNPLALKVLGSMLYKKSKEEWESVVNKFEPTNLSSEIFDVLKISYDGLTDIQKGTFLDIACFLKGRKLDYVTKILDDYDYSLSVLIDKSLITISSDHKIEMHDLLEEMGRNIVNKESPNEVGKRSRLWRQEDGLCTLENDDGTPEVQGIVLDMNKINKDIHLSPQVFKKMYNLRFLKFYNSTYYDYSQVNCLEDISHPYKLRSLIRCGYPLQAPFYNSTYSNYSKVNFSKGISVLSDKLRSLIRYGYPLDAPFYNSTSSDYSKVNFSEGLSVLSNKLRSLIWHGYPLQALPSNFNPNNLVELDLRGSNLKRLWEDCTDIPKLRWLNLSGCTHVTKIPNLSKSPLLELIDLSGCTRVPKIPDLSKSPLLEMIHLRDCSSLLDFPLIAQHPKYLVYLCSRGCTSLRSFPSDIHFESLTSLDLSNCNNLTKFPQISGNNITSLDLSGTAIKELHHYIAHLNGLEELLLWGCKNLETLPSGICNLTSLRHLDLSDCSRLEILPENLGNLESLNYLSVKRAAIKELPHSIAHLNGLIQLFLGGCENLETLPSGICNLTSLRQLDLSDCSRLEILPENLGNLKSLEYLSAKRAAIKELPHSIAHLNGLVKLLLGGCENLETLPSGICILTSLLHLDLSDCSRLEILPENLENLRSLEYLSADRIAICQLPYSMKRLPENLFGRTRLRFTCSSAFTGPSLTRLFLSDCNLNYIPKDIGCLSSLVELDLSVNNFDGLPQSMMELCNLRFLHLDNCNMVVSLIDLPPNLTHLSACDCKQLQSIPNEWDFARILRTMSTPFLSLPTEFIFTNCMNLEETVVGNMLARLVKWNIHPLVYLEYSNVNFWYLRFEVPKQVYTSLKFCYPGRKVPNWFRHTNEGSSIKFQDTFDHNLKGFAVCAVIAFEKYLFNGDSQHKLGVQFDGTCSDGDQSSPANIMSETVYFASRNRTLIDSDHVAFGYCYASNCSLFKRQLKNYSFEFRLSKESPNCRVKSCGVCPIYYQDSDTDDSDEAGTSGSRFDEEEMEPHPKENENLQKRQLKYYSFKFRRLEESPNCRVKSCGVCPRYYQDSDTDDSDEAGTSGSRFDEEEMEPHPKENENLQTVKYAEPIEHIGETSGIRRSRTPNDHLEEEVEPHPKRLNI